MTSQSKATLRLALKDEVLAYQLEAVIYLINELYTGYCWLNAAEQHTGREPYGDYQFAREDFLVVKRVEIGTPNVVELYGWIEPIKETLIFLGSAIAGGWGILLPLLKGSTEAYKNWEEARAIKQKSQHEKRMEPEELKKAQLENRKLELEIERMEMENRKKESPAEKVDDLNKKGKASDLAKAYKQKEQKRIDEKLSYGIFENTVIHIELMPD